MSGAFRSPARSAWLIVALLWVIGLLNYLDRQMLVNMRHSIVSDHSLPATTAAAALNAAPGSAGVATWRSMTEAEFGLLSSAFLWTYGLLSPLAGFLADRFNRRTVILWSLLVWSAVTWLTGHAHTFGELVAARALMGISEACYVPAALALIVEYHRGPTRSLATGLHISGMYVGSILGGLCGWLASTWGWRPGFQVFGVVGLVYGGLLLAAWRPPFISPPAAPAAPGGALPERPKAAEAFAHLLASRGFLILLAVSALVGAAFWTIKNWLPAFFVTEVHVNQAWAGVFSTSTFNAACFFGMLGAGIVADRWSRRNPRARSLVPAICFCVGAPCLFCIGFITAVPLLVLCVVIAGMTQGTLDTNLMPALCTVADARYRATGYGLLNCIGTLTGGAMTYAGGFLKDKEVSFATQFQWGAAAILVIGLLLFSLRPRAEIVATGE